MRNILFMLFLGSAAVFAQQPGNPQASSGPMVIDRVVAKDPAEPSSRPEYFTATYSVPPEEIPHYGYDVVSVFRNGAGGGRTENTEPDELGVIHARVMQQNTVEQYHFLFATHRVTGEQYFIMDLPPLRMSPVLGAIGLAKGKALGTRMVMPVFEEDRDRDILVRVSGQRLSAEDVFDMIWEQTGCVVTDTGRFLRVSGCLESNDREAMP